MRSLFLAAVIIASAFSAHAQQVADDSIDVSVSHPLFERDLGPIVAIDAAHHNFHTMEGRYAPFAALLRNDGFRVVGSTVPFAKDELARESLLVISNALNAANVDRWALPTPSAFTHEEIEAIQSWVNDGGALLLIADHMPFPGAVADLAEAFGVEFLNGDAYRPKDNRPDVFTLAEGTLTNDVVTRGRNAEEILSAVETFRGSAFHLPPAARSLLTFSSVYRVIIPPIALTPENAAVVAPASLYVSAGGLSQGGVMKVGKGRIAVFGEAGMFTAQLLGSERKPFGFNVAPQNRQFVLNVMHWLSGALSE
jgi:hypothetical protein